MTEGQARHSAVKPRFAWRGLRLLFFLLGLSLFFYLLQQAGLEDLFAHARRLGPTFLIVVLLYGGVHFLRTISWRICLREEKTQLPLIPALRLWLCGEAVAHVSFAWTGEVFRAATLSKTIAPSRGLSALVVSRLFYSYASLLLVAISLLAALWVFPPTAMTQALLAGGAGFLFVVTLLPLVAGKQVAGLLGRSKERLGRRPSSVLRGLERFAGALERDIQALLAQDRRNFFLLTALNLLASLAGVLEVYLILRALALPISMMSALFIEGMSKLLSIASFLVPGNIGVREGAIALVFRLLEMNIAPALTLVLARRARALVWVALGSLMFLFDGLAAPPKS